ncbi:MBL fold metallo-hydrolase [Halorhodospira halochloris]|uniref:MBL fold metallo-hydrolase RNA specificity domain-containing protein n=1 Tax=Halorhodospira halochloris TaxID=1052 RepID=UPI001EE88481|nr:MBL fold metallo-hydrolase [Halorhodospira halochloris]MCG5531110.1 MBL fold metallo-hydrolase [Halorhodospira halochloris]
MEFTTIVHHGGAQGVTGSCHQLYATPECSLLVDCGLFQGRDVAPQLDSLTQHRVEFDIASLVGLVITHVHIDHVGRLPYLLAAGYRGPIFCSQPSAQLLFPVIEDALRVGFTRDAELIGQFSNQLEQQLVPLRYGRWHTLVDDKELRLRIRLERAGHILGSAYVKVDLHARRLNRRERLVFSGDLGARCSPLMTAPRSPHRADTLVLEATYGDRRHTQREQRTAQLRESVEHALANGGTVVVPAFSIGRTQELLYELEDLIEQGGEPWRRLEVIVDSPLAARFNRIYRRLRDFWPAEARKRLRRGRHPLSFANLVTVDSHAEHLQTVDYLVRTLRPAVVIAASGMITGGRVVSYLRAMLGEERHQVLFVGYQAEGTPGREIQRQAECSGMVELAGERIPIRARVRTISGYSAHADQTELLGFVKRMKRWPRRIILVHGEQAARRALGEELAQLYARRPVQIVGD